MFHDADFAIVAVPFMVAMMLGMGVMMWSMMKMMMGTGGHETFHGPQRPGERNRGDEMNTLRNELASLRQELESTRTGSAAEGGPEGALSKGLEGQNQVVS